MSALSATGNDRIKPGGNLSPFDVIVLEIDDLYAEAANWADGSPIENQDQCDALDILDKALLAADKQREAIRLDEKRPLDEQVKAIQDRHNPIKDMVARARAALNTPRSAWKAKVAAEKERVAAEERRKAEEAAQAAREAIRASSGDLEAREAAECTLAGAKAQEKVAAKAEKASTTGLGLRTEYRAELTDARAAIAHYWKSKPDAFESLVCDLAAKDVRAGKRAIPGFTIHADKKAL